VNSGPAHASEARAAQARTAASSELPARSLPSRAVPKRMRASQHPAGAPPGAIASQPAVGMRPSQVPVRSTQVSALSPRIQRKPVISSPGGPDEREADDLADAVLAMPDHTAIGSARPTVQRKCTGCEEEEPIKTKHAPSASKSSAPDAGPAVSAAGRGGIPLPPEARSYFEPRFGRDFTAVRVHTGADAAAGARAVQARAYTIGTDITFGAGEFVLATSEGKRLLAHELAHTIQQAGTAGRLKIQRRQMCDEEGACHEEPDVTPGPSAPAAPPQQAGPSGQQAGPSDQQEKDPEAAKPADAGDAAPVKIEGSADAGTAVAAPTATESGDAGRAAATAPATAPPVTMTSGHTPAPPGMAACPDPPGRNVVVVGCVASAAKAPPPKEKAHLPTVERANFGGDADRIKFATELAQCWAEREVKEEIEKRYQVGVAAAKKAATDEAAADTKAAVEAATEGIDPKDRAATRKATADATKGAKAAAAKKIGDAQHAVTRQPVADVTAELAKAHTDWLESDYAATIDGALNRRYGPGWLNHMQAVLNRERARITKAKTAKPKLKKGEQPPPTKPAEEIDAEIEAEMTQVRCEQDQWAWNEVEGIARAWAVGRREQVDFQTIPQTAAPLKSFAPSYTPAEADEVPIPASLMGEADDKALVAPEVAIFLTELERVLAAASPPQTYKAENYPGHGGGSWAGKGFSLDLYLLARKDSRGFWDRSAAISFLLNLNKTANSFGARWRVLYNDFSVAQAVNAATGSRNVVFMGESSGNLNWHGPDPLILHFHLDLEIPKGVQAPAPGPTAVP